MKKLLFYIIFSETIIKKILILIIKAYQKTLSFDHGFMKVFYPFGYCRFHPTCSEYAVRTLQKYHLFTALRKTAWRILRCNPWNKGGNDPA